MFSHPVSPLWSLSISALLKHNLLVFIYLFYSTINRSFFSRFSLPQLTLKLKIVGILERNIFFRGFFPFFVRVFHCSPDTIRPSNKIVIINRSSTWPDGKITAVPMKNNDMCLYVSERIVVVHEAWLFTRTETEPCATIPMKKLITPLGDGRKMDEHEQRCALSSNL